MAVKDMDDFSGLLGEFGAANGLDLAIKGKKKISKTDGKQCR